METVAIQIPASLFAAIYAKYQNETRLVVTECLNQLLEEEPSNEEMKRIKTQHFTRPGAGTVTGRVWEIADQILNKTGRKDRSAVVEICIQEGINMNTANTQYSHWRNAVIESGESS
jgi:hypothetical protein